MLGIGKAKSVKVRLSGCKLLKMGNTEMPMDEVLLEATQFVAGDMDVQVAKVCLQPGTRYGLARYQ